MIRWFTFGQIHEHTLGEEVLNKDCVVEIETELINCTPRDIMIKLFGKAWSMETNSRPDLNLYPRGITRISVRD